MDREESILILSLKTPRLRLAKCLAEAHTAGSGHWLYQHPGFLTLTPVPSLGPQFFRQKAETKIPLENNFSFIYLFHKFSFSPIVWQVLGRVLESQR